MTFNSVKEATNNQGIPYYYKSIMDYASNAFAMNPSILTIVANQEGVILGGGKMTPSDIQGANKLYNCPSTTPTDGE